MELTGKELDICANACESYSLILQGKQSLAFTHEKLKIMSVYKSRVDLYQNKDLVCDALRVQKTSLERYFEVLYASQIEDNILDVFRAEISEIKQLIKKLS